MLSYKYENYKKYEGGEYEYVWRSGGATGRGGGFPLSDLFQSWRNFFFSSPAVARHFAHLSKHPGAAPGSEYLAKLS